MAGTGAAVPSDAIADLKANAETLDQFVSSTDVSVVTRTGKNIKTIAGVEQDADKAVKSAGWFVAGNFADGFTFTAYNQVGRDASGEMWSYNGSLPFTVPAGTVPSEPDYTNRGDAAVRSALADAGGVKNVSNAKIEIANTADLKAAIWIANGDTVETTGYYAAGDGGGAVYDINNDADVDGYSSFALDNGLYAHLRHTGVIKSTQFGVMPDGVTNWEGTEGARMRAVYAALDKGIEVYFVRVGGDTLYFTGMNIYNNYAQEWTMSFQDGVEFGNILHIISSGTAVFDEEISNVATGTNPTITTVSAHGMATERFCTFEGTGTSLDGQSALVTPTGTNTATVEAVVTGTYSGAGTFTDTPIKGVTLKGTYVTYDRWGLINVNGLRADRVVCKSDPSKHTTGKEGGGVHIFTMCKNFNVDEVVIEDTKSQSASANQHAAFACDGIGLENLNFKKVWVKDTKVNGAIIQGEGYHIGQLIIERYGRGIMSSTIPFVGQVDLFGKPSSSVAHGVWISRATGRIDHIVVDQKSGFTGRGFAQKDVCFDRDFLLWNTANSDRTFTDVKTGFSVGHIECRNPQYVGVDLGSYKGWCTPQIDKITFGIIPDDNDAVISDSLKAERGLVNIGYTRATIGQIRAANIKETALVLNNPLYTYQNTPDLQREPSLNCQMIDCEDHAATIVDLNCPHDIGSIRTDSVTIKDNYYLEPSVLVTSKVRGSSIGSIHARIESGSRNKKLLEYSASSSTIGSIEAHNFIANGTTNDAVLHFLSARYSTVSNFKVTASSLASSAVGVKYTSTYNFKTGNALVENFNLGVKNGGSNVRLLCEGCVSLNNTTPSDLPATNLVVNSGNFQWTV